MVKTVKRIAFSEKQILNLIDLYRKKECLWNTKSPFYNNHAERRDALRFIAKSLNYNEETIKKKITSIRATYLLEKKKIKDSLLAGNGADTMYRPTVIWFEHMNFLDGVIIPRKTTLNLEVQTTQLENDSQNFGYFKHFKGTNLLLKRDVVPHKKLTKVVSQRTKKPMLEFVQCIQDEETSEVSSPTKSSDPITPSDELMRMESSMSSAEDQILFEEIEDSKDDITLTSPSISIPVEKKRKRVYTSNTEKDIDSTRTSLCNISHEDVFDHFGKLIASQLRGIRMGDALQLQSDISAMVNQRLMSIYNRDKSMAALEQPSQSTVLSPIYNDPEEIDTKPIIYTDS
ncbi:uncharacterized protein [Onthophagus taurus]|uniref:uncharacterized protein isoform X1 n=1 Tax=Onthophagus taurus TaxID=166361 RepID=UPI0039BDAC6E